MGFSPHPAAPSDVKKYPIKRIPRTRVFMKGRVNMPRPSKDPSLAVGNSITKEDAAIRHKVKEMFGAEVFDEIKAPSRLNSNQKKIFNTIKQHIENAGVYGSIDAQMLETTAIAIDRLQVIEKMINQDFDNIYNRELMAAKSKYTADFMKGVEFFGMAPTARAKFGSLLTAKKEEEKDPLLKILKPRSS
jgi:phage terminase small subunit